jgi:hypothetical protein
MISAGAAAARSQVRAVPSRLAVTSLRPPASNAAAVIAPAWPARTGRASHRPPAWCSRTVPSAQPIASVPPSGLAASTVARYPSEGRQSSCAPASRLQVRIVWS